MPKESCSICEGTGKRQAPPETGAGDIDCNGCKGEGVKDAWASNYPFEVENVQEFVNFLKECGGFEIW